MIDDLGDIDNLPYIIEILMIIDFKSSEFNVKALNGFKSAIFYDSERQNVCR
ncbi:predicted protein [Sclerotinia sclerotiorum 1980 UF-70]|uniref:Uncharacterized protein n=1 Tax=Sclerotinia sclerotiorum (strain ATCC 18683 / 1980 / Ss-1) TaxID=665079 RepID=A7EQ84_SCLS1|nr:predicted protein [Sclerotinia sclerotiorum 1980 UF-70]EDO05000.1 predicted protein [Sclerotinia sclerotiorum 1980 UF-70]